MILARNEVDYFKPIFLEDDLFCYTKVVSFGTKSFEMRNIITKKDGDNEIVCAEGKTILVCFNYKLNQTIEIPEEWKMAVNKYELP